MATTIARIYHQFPAQDLMSILMWVWSISSLKPICCSMNFPFCWGITKTPNGIQTQHCITRRLRSLRLMVRKKPNPKPTNWLIWGKHRFFYFSLFLTGHKCPLSMCKVLRIWLTPHFWLVVWFAGCSVKVYSVVYFVNHNTRPIWQQKKCTKWALAKSLCFVHYLI